jgi:hypothetical protein
MVRSVSLSDNGNGKLRIEIYAASTIFAAEFLESRTSPPWRQRQHRLYLNVDLFGLVYPLDDVCAARACVGVHRVNLIAKELRPTLRTAKGASPTDLNLRKPRNHRLAAHQQTFSGKCSVLNSFRHRKSLAHFCSFRAQVMATSGLTQV